MAHVKRGEVWQGTICSSRHADQYRCYFVFDLHMETHSIPKSTKHRQSEPPKGRLLTLNIDSCVDESSFKRLVQHPNTANNSNLCNNTTVTLYYQPFLLLLSPLFSDPLLFSILFTSCHFFFVLVCFLDSVLLVYVISLFF